MLIIDVNLWICKSGLQTICPNCTDREQHAQDHARAPTTCQAHPPAVAPSGPNRAAPRGPGDPRVLQVWFGHRLLWCCSSWGRRSEPASLLGSGSSGFPRGSWGGELLPVFGTPPHTKLEWEKKRRNPESKKHQQHINIRRTPKKQRGMACGNKTSKKHQYLKNVASILESISR